MLDSDWSRNQGQGQFCIFQINVYILLVFDIQPDQGQVYTYIQVFNNIINQSIINVWSPMKAIAHEKLITEDYYCETSDLYDFSKCAYEKITAQAGCRSFLTNGTNINVCQNLEEYQTLMTEYQKITDLEKNELVNKTQCYFPCNYMEYKVRIDLDKKGGNTVSELARKLVN